MPRLAGLGGDNRRVMRDTPTHTPPGRRFRLRNVGLGGVLIALSVAVLAGLWLKTQPDVLHGFKAACAEGDWHGQQYSRLCYSDIVPLLSTEELGDYDPSTPGTQHRLPYLDPCKGTQNCDEYPVLSMYLMRLAAWTSSGYGGFLLANVFWLAVAAGITAVCLYLIAGPRALWFALAPTLVIYGFMNWDLLAVAFATAATLAFLRRRDVTSGVLLGLGAAAKLYPALLVIPFAVHRFREREPDRGIHLTWAAAGTWVAVNLPFAVVGFHGWSEFFRFNAKRPADFDSLWYIGCHLAGRDGCVNGSLFPSEWPVLAGIQAATAFSAAAFVAGTALVWLLRSRVRPEFSRWTLCLPVVILFLVTNKVYSPQYGLWLLPLFVLVLPPLGPLRPLTLFALFEITDVAVFVTRFTWFHTLPPFSGWGAPFWAFESAVLARAAVLVLCLVAWVRGPEPALTGPAMLGQESAPVPGRRRVAVTLPPVPAAPEAGT